MISSFFLNEHSFFEQEEISLWAMVGIDLLLSSGFIEILFIKSFTLYQSSDLPVSDACSKSDVVPLSLLVLIGSDFS
jgi:hypothetical protein